MSTSRTCELFIQSGDIIHAQLKCVKGKSRQVRQTRELVI